MREASKTRRLLTDTELAALTGRGLDIGCGDDPIRPDVQRFDLEHGDANCVTGVIRELESFDYVFSSHCLEHMRDPRAAISDWWQLVKPGGALIVIVPDEDLYEQGYWPSLFNSDHKATFSIAKEGSWSPVSRNLSKLAEELPGAEVASVRVQDAGYDRKHKSSARWPRALALQAVRVRRRVSPALGRMLDRCYVALGLPVDQTAGDAVAQNILVLTKRKNAA